MSRVSPMVNEVEEETKGAADATNDNNTNISSAKEKNDSSPLVESNYLALPPRAQSASQVCVQPLQVIGVQKEPPVAWSPNGDRLAFASRNYSIYICKASGPESPQKVGMEEVQLKGPPTTSIDTSNPYRVKLEKIYNGHREEVNFISFHPTNLNMMISGGKDGLFVWDLSTDSIVRKVSDIGSSPDAHESDILCICWLYDGIVLATGSRDANIKIWDVRNDFRCMETLYGHKAPVLSIIYSPVAKTLISAGRDSTIKKWDITSLYPSVISQRDDDGSISCNLLANLDGHRGDVVTLASIHDGKTVFSGARDNTIKAWDMVMNRELRTISGHGADVRQFAFFLTEEYMYSASLDGTIKLWKLLENQDGSLGTLTEEEIENDREKADKKALDDILSGGSFSVESAATASANAAASAGRDELVATINAHVSDIVAMQVNPVHPIMVTASLYEIKIWDITNITAPKPFEDFVGHSDAVTSLSILGNPGEESKLLSSSLDYHLHIYDVNSIRRNVDIKLTGSVLCTVVSGSMVYGAGNDYCIRGYNVTESMTDSVVSDTSHKAVVELVGHAGRVYCMAVSPDGNILVSGAHDYSICLWDLKKVASGKTSLSPRQQIEEHQGFVLDLVFNDAGTMLASCGNDHSVKVWKVSSGMLGVKLSLKWTIVDAHVSVVSSLVFGREASDTALFSGGWDFNIKVWTPSTSAPKAPTEVLQGHMGRITNLQCTKNGLYLFSSAADGSILCWNAVQPYNILCCYMGSSYDGAVTSLTLGTSCFATGFEDGMIKVWPMFTSTQESGEYANLFMKAEQYAEESASLTTGNSVRIAGMKSKV